jgi:hypothetical protein
VARADLTRRRGGAEGGERSLTQIVKKVGTPRRRCPKHQAQRAVSGIQRRLRRERRTATARHPYLFGKGCVAWSLNQIVKKVGTPRSWCPKHQARTRRLWDTKAPSARETDGDGAPSLPFFRISMHRGHCFFAIRLCRAKEGGHGRPGRVETGLLFSHHAHWNQGALQRTQARRAVSLY